MYCCLQNSASFSFLIPMIISLKVLNLSVSTLSLFVQIDDHQASLSAGKSFLASLIEVSGQAF